VTGKIRGIGVTVGSVAGAAGVVRQLQKAHRSGDRLLLLNALAGALALVTGLALAVRAMRSKDGDR